MEKQSDTPRADAFFAEYPSGFGVRPFTRDLERELAAVTRERDEARAKVAELVENGERLKAVADSAVRDAADMAEAKCAPLRDQIHQLQFDQQWAFDLVYRIRQALGDNGKLMQDELIEHCRKLVADAEAVKAETERCIAACEFMRPSVARGHPVNEAVFAAASVAVDSCIEAIRARAEKETT